MDYTVSDLEKMSADLLDLLPDGWNRSIYYDISKLAEEMGEVAETLNKGNKTPADTGEELSDLIAVCFVISLKMGIELNKFIGEKQKKRIAKLLNKYHDSKVPEGMEFRVKV